VVLVVLEVVEVDVVVAGAVVVDVVVVDDVVVEDDVVVDRSGSVVVVVDVVVDVVVEPGCSAAAGRIRSTTAAATRSAPARAREGWGTSEDLPPGGSRTLTSVTGRSCCETGHLNSGQDRP
jgi:hypothetical protein